MKRPQKWDIFCHIVDNFGDIGVCWRLARQLASEYDYQIRLWVDDLATFQRLFPLIDIAAPIQLQDKIEIRLWAEPFPVVEPYPVVISAFGCQLPKTFALAMVHQTPQPIWINLDYLSAENWIEGCHTLPSPHQNLLLTQYFFFPGFTPQSGGLLREKNLIEHRKQFQANDLGRLTRWQSLNLPQFEHNAIFISLFCYPHPAIQELLEAWSQSEQPIHCFAPVGMLEDVFFEFFGGRGKTLSKGALSLHSLPFLEQPQFDRLLWACDCNFVRGEDSFVRAQWAGLPMVWHIYPQSEKAHLLKLRAFLERYCEGLPLEAAADLSTFWQAWNEGKGVGQAWPLFWRHRIKFKQHARAWADSLASQVDLAANLVQFCQNRL